MKKLSKGLYLGSICGGMGTGIINYFLGLIMMYSNDDYFGQFLMVFGIAWMIYSVVMSVILLYKIWEAIQDGNVRTTPGRAIGFMFIPFFNMYWGFQSLWGWSVDFNKYIKEKGVDTPAISEGVTLSICILTICSLIPILNLFSWIPLMVLLIIFYNKAIVGANAVIDHNT